MIRFRENLRRHGILLCLLSSTAIIAGCSDSGSTTPLAPAPDPINNPITNPVTNPITNPITNPVTNPDISDDDPAIARMLGTVNFEYRRPESSNIFRKQFRFTRANLGTLDSGNDALRNTTDDSSYICYVFQSGRFFCEQLFDDGFREMFVFVLANDGTGQGDYEACLSFVSGQECFDDLQATPDGTVIVQVISADADADAFFNAPVAFGEELILNDSRAYIMLEEQAEQ